MRVLVLNTGSSSLKHAIVDTDGFQTLANGEERWESGAAIDAHREALARVLDGAGPTPHAVGHRVVHGGARFSGPVRVDADVRSQIEALVPLAPLHNRSALEAIDAAAAALPGVPQIACFDTAFHATLPPAAATYALPRAWSERFGLRRHGFHGLSVAWSSTRARELLSAEATRRLVVCHLGSGSSITAVLDGHSVDTTMGFTPLEGVPMATRAGSVDPGLLVYVLRNGVDVEQLDHGLQHQSGLLGLSGVSADLRDVLAAADQGDQAAAVAYEVLVRGVSAAVGAMTTALGGLDCLVFTAGAGEHSARLRRDLEPRLRHLGVRIDEERNRSAEPDCDIAAPGGARVLLIRAREELVIARECLALL